MLHKTILVDKKSNIPLFGIDFIGIIDRGTNVIEIKPITLCNLNCIYCFVSAGDYLTNFVVEPDYLLENIKLLIDLKGKRDIEIHIAPYGEILLYDKLTYLIEKLKTLEGVYKISMQTNGLLLTENIITELEKAGLDQINISLNTLNKERAEYLSDLKGYQLNNLLNMIDFLIKSKIKIIIAPVWIPKINDQDIQELIRFVQALNNEAGSPDKVQLGIQKYLIYKKTGRRVKKIRPKSWDYFYSQLKILEKKFNMKLKLGPKDFNIHKRKGISLPLKKGDITQANVISKGRWDNEYITSINQIWGIKLVLQRNQIDLPLIGNRYDIRIIKSKQKENLLTGVLNL